MMIPWILLSSSRTTSLPCWRRRPIADNASEVAGAASVPRSPERAKRAQAATFLLADGGYGTVGPTHESQLPKTVLDSTQDVYREPPLPRDLGGRHGDLGTGRAGRVYRRLDVFH